MSLYQCIYQCIQVYCNYRGDFWQDQYFYVMLILQKQAKLSGSGETADVKPKDKPASDKKKEVSLLRSMISHSKRFGRSKAVNQ